jgi:exopolysaccharide biosynthesis polyprenyl glycosylphosphotransferase
LGDRKSHTDAMPIPELAAAEILLVESELADSVQQPEIDLLERPGAAKREGSALRAYLDLDRAEAKRRAAIPARQKVFRRTLAFVDALSIGIVLYAGADVLGSDKLTLAALPAVALLILVMKTIGLYDRDENLLRPTTLDEVPALFQVATLSTLLLWIVGDLIVDGDLGRRQVLGMWMLLFLLMIVGRSLARAIATRLVEPERCLVVGDADSARALGRKLSLDSSASAEVVGWVSGLTLESQSETIPELPAGLYRIIAEQQVHRVVLAPGKVDSETLLHLVRKLSEMHVSVSLLPATPAVAGSSVELDDIHGLTLLGIRGFDMTRSSRVLKRAFDLTASALMLVLLSPLLLFVAIAIRLDSRGPVLFVQRRVGRDGRVFEMLKFRSMFVGSETRRDEFRHLSLTNGFFKIEEDPRVTRIGRLIRRLSLDELPQLINVLRGEMSLVGPRPLVPDEDSQIEGLYRRRLDIAPGITGYWQALGGYRIPMAEMVRLDYLYVATWSLWHDVRILIRTVPFVVGRNGA